MFGLGLGLGFQSPGGTPGPSSVSGLVGWYKGDVGYGGGSWTDQSSAGNTLTLTGTSAGAALNGHATVSFNGSSDRADRATFSGVGGNAVSIFAVAKATAAASSSDFRVVAMYGDGFPVVEAVCIDDSSHAGVVNAISVIASGTTNVVNSFHRIGQTSIAGGNQLLYVDNAQEASQAVLGGDPLGSNKSFAVGRLVGSGKFFQGLVAEVVVYDHVLSSGDRGIVDAYFTSRYGI